MLRLCTQNHWAPWMFVQPFGVGTLDVFISLFSFQIASLSLHCVPINQIPTGHFVCQNIFPVSTFPKRNSNKHKNVYMYLYTSLPFSLTHALAFDGVP